MVSKRTRDLPTSRGPFVPLTVNAPLIFSLSGLLSPFSISLSRGGTHAREHTLIHERIRDNSGTKVILLSRTYCPPRIAARKHCPAVESMLRGQIS